MKLTSIIQIFWALRPYRHIDILPKQYKVLGLLG